MQPKESYSAGSLYEYVQLQRLQACEVERLAEEAKRQELVAKEQRHINYEDLPNPVRGLFARFSVIELLEEVKTRFWGSGLMSIVYIEGGACVKLENHFRTVVQEQDYVSHTTYDYGFSPLNPSVRSGGGWVRTGQWIPADLARVIVVRAIKLESTASAPDYALHCSYFQKFGPVSDFKYRNREPSGRTPAIIDRRIEAYLAPDILKKILGDNLLGKHGELR